MCKLYLAVAAKLLLPKHSLTCVTIALYALLHISFLCLYCADRNLYRYCTSILKGVILSITTCKQVMYLNLYRGGNLPIATYRSEYLQPSFHPAIQRSAGFRSCHSDRDIYRTGKLNQCSEIEPAYLNKRIGWKVFSSFPVPKYGERQHLLRRRDSRTQRANHSFSTWGRYYLD